MLFHLRSAAMAATLGLAIALIACTDTAELPSEPGRNSSAVSPNIANVPGPNLPSADRLNSTQASDAERQAGEIVARALAMALQDPAVRQEVKRALASSRVSEHKLHLHSFLQGRGGAILSVAYRKADLSEGEFQQAMANLRQLEFYMPVLKHRVAWSGGPDVIVAVAVQKNEQPAGFRIDGSRVQLDRNVEPSAPTLVLTQVESDFRDQILMNKAGVPANGCVATTIESLEQAARRCDAGGAKAIRSGPSLNALRSFEPGVRFDFGSDPEVVGLYATFLRVLDAHEYWFQGEPELEIHVTGKRNGPSGQPIDYQCSGENAADPFGTQPGIRDFAYVFDMNTNFWEGKEVRLLNGAQLDSLQAAEPAGFNVSLWEDDQEACIVRQSSASFFQTAVQATQSIARGVNAVRARDYGVIAGTIQELAALIQGDDDYVGLLVFKDSTEYAGTNPGNTHMIYDGTTQNGRATLTIKRVNRSASISGFSSVPPYTSNTWTATASGTSGGEAYNWTINGETIQTGSSNVLTYQNDGTDFSVGVVVVDALGVVGSSAMYVSANGCTPPEIIC